MSVNEVPQLALVRFTGLGIICFNDEQQRGEIAVIRDDKHQYQSESSGPFTRMVPSRTSWFIATSRLMTNCRKRTS
jgi:hypothetical protein